MLVEHWMHFVYMILLNPVTLATPFRGVLMNKTSHEWRKATSFHPKLYVKPHLPMVMDSKLTDHS
jgi:hypothetical protein